MKRMCKKGDGVKRSIFFFFFFCFLKKFLGKEIIQENLFPNVRLCDWEAVSATESPLLPRCGGAIYRGVETTPRTWLKVGDPCRRHPPAPDVECDSALPGRRSENAPERRSHVHGHGHVICAASGRRRTGFFTFHQQTHARTSFTHLTWQIANKTWTSFFLSLPYFVHDKPFFFSSL